MERIMEKLHELLINPEHSQKFENVKNATDFKTALSEMGLEVSETEAEEILVAMGETMIQEGLVMDNGELTEKGLEHVTGGALPEALAALGAGIGTTISWPVLAVAGVGLLAACAVGAYISYNRKKRG